MSALVSLVEWYLEYVAGHATAPGRDVDGVRFDEGGVLAHADQG
jgi:hypothetical protein